MRPKLKEPRIVNTWNTWSFWIILGYIIHPSPRDYTAADHQDFLTTKDPKKKGDYLSGFHLTSLFRAVDSTPNISRLLVHLSTVVPSDN